ncbi:hypothetical protein F4801DRAFT_175971 [Xylaria longipes]|nr:hypothetical protein F4801DRAFT_175971 [Xylaria longipes]
MKDAASLLSRTVTGLRGAFSYHVSPASGKTTFDGDKQQRRAVADMLHSDLNPWHEYEQLASDTEDDNPPSQSPRKKTKRLKFDAWVGRLMTAVEDSFAAQAVFVRTLQ